MKGKPKRKKFTVRKIGKHRYAVFAILPIIQTDNLAKAKTAKQLLDKMMKK